MDDEFWDHLLRKGTELAEVGDLRQAAETLEQVTRSGHPDAAPKAATLMGQLMMGSGDTEAAQMMFRYAMDANHPAASPRAALHLGELLQEQQDILGASHAYGAAAESDDVDAATTAKVALETLHDEFEQHVATLSAGQADYERAHRHSVIDERDAAETAYRSSIESGDPEYAPQSAIDLAMLLAREADAEQDGATDQEVRTLLRHAVDSEHRAHAPMAAGLLGEILEGEDDTDGAIEMLAIAAEAETAWLADTAGAKLAELLVSLERYPEAIERFTSLVAAGATETGAHAAYRLGVLVDALTDEYDTALACFRYATDLAPEEVAENARSMLEQVAETNAVPIRTEPSSPEEIRGLVAALLARTATTDDQPSNADPAARAADAAADPVEESDPRSPEEIATWAAQAPEEELWPFCERTMNAGFSLYERDETLAAVRTLEQVMATGHLVWAPAAAARVAEAFHAHQDVRAAESAIGRLAELGHPHLIPHGWLAHAKQMVASGKFSEAEDGLRRAVNGADAHSGAAYAAQCVLRVLRDDRDEIAPTLRLVEQHDDGALVLQLLDFVYQIAETKKREAAEAFRTMEAMARLTDYQEAIDEAKSYREALTD